MKTLRKALKILDSFSENNQSQGITEISSKLSLPKSTVHALLKTLKEEGYIIRDAKRRKYSLGFKFLDMAQKITSQFDLIQISLPIMRELSRICDEDIGLNIQVEGKRICIAIVESRHFVRHVVPLGKTLPLHCSAAGKVLMAYLPLREINQIINKFGFERFTPNTIIQKDKLLENLNLIRKRAYGESREEFGIDGAALAFPIFGRTKGEVVGAISIQSTVTRLNKETRDWFIEEGLKAAKKISMSISGNY